MENYNTILTDKQQNISIITDKYDKYEYLTGEEILTSYQSRMIEQAKFTYYILGRAFEKQIKTIKHQGEKQRKALEEYRKQLIKYCDAKESLTHLKQK